ncbi:uncharacterized protein SPAPADRAFT_59400 [Spathaspora passalidarum NRRL Y-27907]|uniref:RGS domain-containing protein n=1 Tax=Spathaspora passalidarum (strain NRRL Y-27907 / 11-Y1) TaxID=619300 RepID=G3AJU1_SPAPN|nr:uncharacterized protein SPAPADRAFT_59400 [Spathaspora passalidarum NRRL Y-27907]EGW33992.1 hypothetical protein SPAPADRAFT_59400 [Spathaspora passalidarum NRRL Y-27907]
MMIASATEVNHESLFNYNLNSTSSSLAAISTQVTPISLHSPSPPTPHTPSSPSQQPQIISEPPQSSSPPTVIPTLDEILNTSINAQNSDFNLDKFVSYLSSVHGNENLEFVLDVNSYLSLRPPTISHWQQLYTKYIELEAPCEVNLPCHFRSQLTLNKMPDFTLLIKCRRYIHDDILINLYHEFVKHVKSAFECPFRCCTPPNDPTVSPRHSVHYVNNKAAPPLTHSQSVYCSATSAAISSSRLKHSNSVSGASMFRQPPPLHKHSQVGYDYYAIPNSDCSSTSEEDNSPRTTRNNSAGSVRGGSLGSLVGDYKSMIKKFKFRRSSTDD